MEKQLKYGELLSFYGKLLTDVQRDIMERYYLYDNSLGEIAQQSGVTRQSVRGTIVKAQRILDKAEDSLKTAEKSYRMIDGLNRLKSEADIDLQKKIDELIMIMEE